MSRDVQGARCPRCALQRRVCACSILASVATRTRFFFVRHVAERNRPTNSVRWARQMLPNSDLVEYGSAALPVSRIEVPADACLLMPGGDRDYHRRPTCLVVLDGSWSQVRHMRQRLSQLASRRVIAAPANRGGPRLRREAHPDHMATLESIVSILRVLEGDTIAEDVNRQYCELVRRAIATSGGRGGPR